MVGLSVALLSLGEVPSTSARVDSIIRAEMSKRQVPGAQVAIVQRGRIIYSKSFGMATLQYDVPVKNSTRFTINSATKSFTGVAILQLVENGLLRLDDPIGKYVSDIPKAWQQVTIRELACHVSGIPNIVEQLAAGLDEDEAWTKVQTRPIEYAPNTKSSYNQTNYLLLGKVIDKQAGKSFVEFIEQNQFVAVGMKNTLFADSRDVVKNLAQAYSMETGQDGKVVYQPTASQFPRMLWTGAGICTTAEDVAKWIIALQGKRILKSKSSIDGLWERGKTVSPWVIGWPASERKEHSWVGGIGGARSAFYVYPNDDLAVVILTNLLGASPEDWIDSVARVFVPEIP